ncbi:AAA family ATPase [Methylobacterium sp. Leaf465]|uniref:AAA family ATPase n=1 Tax=Methylobacterium sp. Leaf465 TaxID=1736385 RepID=UPI001FCCCD1C|nr:AAA family ATPase [Methylobacterium sp. Leaf465]
MQMTNVPSFTDKYRPQTFGEVFGQPSAVGCLSGLIKRGQRGRNILLHGAVGSGKTSLARLYARALNCEAPETDGSPCCDRCESCQIGTDAKPVGFFEYNVSRDGGGVREVRHWAHLHNHAERDLNWRILFFDEAQALEPKACDALLAAVEQPSERVLFFFATTEVERIRPALRSRLFDLLIRPLPVADAITFLRKYAEAEGVDPEPGALELLAGLRNGYPRDLLLGLDRVCEPGTRMTVEDVRAAFDVDQTEILLNYFLALADADLARQTDIVFGWQESGSNRSRWIRTFLISLYHNDILGRRLVVDGVIESISESSRTAILDRFCRRLGITNRGELASFWHQMLDFWLVSETAVDETALSLRLTLFHRLVNGVVVKTTIGGKAQGSQPLTLAAAAWTVCRGFGLPRADIREPHTEEGFLGAADVRRIVNCASFLTQEYGVLFDAAFEIRPAEFGIEDTTSALALIEAFRDDLSTKAEAYGLRFACLMVLERDEYGIIARLVTHLPRQAFADVGGVAAWAQTWRHDGALAAARDGVLCKLAPEAEAPALSFHWDAVLNLCAGLDAGVTANDSGTGKRRSLLKLLGVHARSTRRFRSPAQLSVSTMFFEEAIADACRDSLDPLSAFDDEAWTYLKTGWERREHPERMATRADREAERNLVQQRYGNTPEARTAFDELTQRWTVDPHQRRRRWRGWWS